jgi:hypothetical protein
MSRQVLSVWSRITILCRLLRVIKVVEQRHAFVWSEPLWIKYGNRLAEFLGEGSVGADAEGPAAVSIRTAELVHRFEPCVKALLGLRADQPSIRCGL